jgi:hypothetical protein
VLPRRGRRNDTRAPVACFPSRAEKRHARTSCAPVRPSGGFERLRPEVSVGACGEEAPAHRQDSLHQVECPRQESNLRTRFRKPLLYPLSYGGFYLQMGWFSICSSIAFAIVALGNAPRVAARGCT